MNYSDTDTIAAISTAVSESGIGIIRISGPDAIRTADSVFQSPKHILLSEVPSHTIHYGFVVDDDIVDEVLVSVMRAPKTFTAEDTVEINCHGGILAMKKVLDTVLSAGTSLGANVRTAQPGEFTKRAFLNGRIDLSRAEAVMDVIGAKNEFALKNSVSQIRGSLYREISALRSEIIYQVAHIEASLDDPEHLDFAPHIQELSVSAGEWKNRIQKLIDTADNGRLAAEGIRTVIVGKPNAGKSSLMNLMVGEDRAIVTPIAGTTRDVLTETIYLQGMTLLITDTAGIRNTTDTVEKIGVERARKHVEEADLLLWIVDSSTELDENDEEIAQLVKDRQTIILLNKTDLTEVTGEEKIRAILAESDQPIIPFSAKEQTGTDALAACLKDKFFHGELSFNDEVVITNARHRELLEKAVGSLHHVSESIDAGLSEDFFSIDLMSAYETLGKIIGEEVGEDLVEEIFRKFCMGK